MNKRGQIFIIVAFVICFILFTVITPYNTSKETVALQNFDELTENYKNEEPKVINKAIADGKDQTGINNDLKTLTENFVDYAKQKDPKFGILYVVKDAEGNYIIKNYLNEQLVKVTAKAAGQTAPEVSVSSADGQNRGDIELQGLGEIGANANDQDFDPNTGEANLGKLGGYNTLTIKISGQDQPFEFTLNELEQNSNGWIVRSQAECDDPSWCEQKSACSSDCF